MIVFGRESETVNGITCKCLNRIDGSEEVHVSIVIRCKDEAVTLQRTLDLISLQKGANEAEVIIIDSGSNDGSLEIALRNPVNVVSIDPKDFSFGSSINLGVKLASGTVVVFVSAHAFPVDNMWLDHLIKAVKGDCVGAYSRQIYTDEANFLEKVSIDKSFGKKSLVQRVNDFETDNKFVLLKKYGAFSNASSCILKSYALDHPFADICASEDREWALRAVVDGKMIRYCSDSRIIHFHNESLSKWYRRILINSRAVFEITGFHTPLIMVLPLFMYRILRDLMYMVKTLVFPRPIELLTLPVFELAYAFAHYRGSK